MKTKTKLRNLKMTGKIIGISEEKEFKSLIILLDKSILEIFTRADEYNLGDKIGFKLNLEIINMGNIANN